MAKFQYKTYIKTMIEKSLNNIHLLFHLLISGNFDNYMAIVAHFID